MPDNNWTRAQPERVEGTFPCFASGKLPVNHAACIRSTTNAQRNNQFCATNKCECPWRRCLTCVLQGVTGPEARIVNRSDGLCEFHNANGVRADRKSTPAAANTTPTRAAPDRTVPKPTSAASPHTDPVSATRLAQQTRAPTLPAVKKPKPSKVTGSQIRPAAGASSPNGIVRNDVPSSLDLQAAALTPAYDEAPSDVTSIPTAVASATTLMPAAGVEVVGQVLRVPTGRVIPQPGQPREEFDPESMKLLVASMKSRGQVRPVLLVPIHGNADADFMICDGETRWRGAKLAGIEYVLGIYYEGLSITDAKEIYRTSVVANFHHNHHSPLERAKIVTRLMGSEHNLTLKEVSVEMGISEFTLTRDLRLLKLPFLVQALMSKELPEDQRLPPASAHLLLNYPPEFQGTVARELVDEKLTLNAAVRHVQRRAVEEAVVEDRSQVRGRSPFDYFRKMLSGIAGLAGRVERYKYPPGRTLDDVLKARSPEELEEFQEAVLTVTKQLQEMAETAAQIAKKKQ